MAQEIVTGQSPKEEVSKRAWTEGGYFCVKGRNGTLAVSPQKVVIRRKGTMSFVTQGIRGDNEIRIEQISAVRFRKPGAFTTGYISIAFLGGSQFTGGIKQAVKDENTVMFSANATKDMEHAKELVEQYQAAIPPRSQPIANASVADELEKLARLRDKGILSADEFDAKKRQLLGL